MSVLLITPAPALAGVSFLTATPAPAPAPASGQEFGSASTLGFVVLVLFFIAVAFLARSMAKHLKKIQKPFEDAAEAEAERSDQPDEPTGGAESAVPESTPAEDTTTATAATTEPTRGPVAFRATGWAGR